MVRFDPRRLDARDRERWLRQLRETPLLSAPTTTPWRWIVALGCAAGLAFAFALTRDPIERWSHHFHPRGHIALVAAFAIGCGLLAIIAVELVASRYRARCAWPCGRFLHRFGYVESDLRSVVFVPGPEIEIERVIGRFTRTFSPGAITIRLRCGSRRRAFELWGSELDVPVEAIARLGDARAASPGYRGESPLVVPQRARVRPPTAPWRSMALVAAAMVSGAAIAGVSISPARAESVCSTSLYEPACTSVIEETYPWWARLGVPYAQLRDAAITADVDLRIAKHYRDAVQIAAHRGGTFEVDLPCNPSTHELRRWTQHGWRGEAALPAPLEAPHEMWFLGDLLRPRPHAAPASLTARCSFEGRPVELVSPHVLRALVDVRATWQLTVEGASPVERETSFTLQLRSDRRDQPLRWYWDEPPPWRLRRAIGRAILAE